MPKGAKTAAVLQSILADLVNLSLQSKQAHWNVRGPFFRPLHEMFDEMTDQYREWYDDVAERARALGAPADGRASTIVATSKVEELPAGELADRQAVSLMTAAVEGAASRMREALGPLGEQDPVTQDLVIGIVAGLEKQAWMLRVQAT